ncbi:MAG: PAS domain-containing protein [Myxococcaceae bacterium]
MQAANKEIVASNEELQSLNEELQSANEELQSLNEELQSANEELQTAKEELQASNEELTTVNDESNIRNTQLSKLNDDFINLTTSIQLPVVVVEDDCRIRFFTPAAEKIFNLVSTDVGRPLRDIKQKILLSDLEGLILQVIKDLHSYEQEVLDVYGSWYALKIQPYKTSDNKISGAILTFSNIDALKKNQKLENEKHEEFNKIVRQANHDIASPIAALEIFLSAQASKLPEEQRVGARNSLNSIRGITSSMLLHFRTEDKAMSPFYDVLLLPALLEALQEKKFEHRNSKINFCENMDENMNFSFVHLDFWNFKRMFSNLINNAVEALSSTQDPKLVITLGTTATMEPDKVCITISDNGIGMPAFVREQILSNLPVVSIKRNGFGIGYAQIREMLELHGIKLEVESTEHVGTKIILTLPTLKLPHYIASEIELHSCDTVIVLDDDPSIHGAWDLRFSEVPGVKLKHFTQGRDAVEYFKNLSEASKQQVLLLADYELLNQNMNGIDVINLVKPIRAILVTGHYFNQKLVSDVKDYDMKILPKSLASKVPISCEKSS